jgi:pyruvate/2-oxoglutarate dehydrogenase complex dihydrolipoamide acyltransferase (E2) component
MAETIGMPKLGLTMETGAVGTWLVGEGDEVKVGAVIAEIVTEKITYDLETEAAGVVLKILLEEEVEVPVGTPIIVIGQPGEEAS